MAVRHPLNRSWLRSGVGVRASARHAVGDMVLLG